MFAAAAEAVGAAAEAPTPFPISYLPVLRIGNVSAFALAVAVAFLVGVRIVLVTARRRGEDTERWWPIIWRAFVGAVLGARIGYVIGAPTMFLHDPWAALSIGDGGLSLFGAVIGGIVFCRPHLRATARPLRPVLDAVAPVILVMIGIGRLGQAVTADALGIESLFGLGYRCPAVATASACADSYVGAHAGAVVVPTWLLDVVLLGLLLAFVQFRWVRSGHGDGDTFLVLAGAYAAGRFVCDFARVGPRVVFLTSGQLAEVVIVVVVAVLWRRWHVAARVSKAEAKAQRALAKAEKVRARADAAAAKAQALAGGTASDTPTVAEPVPVPPSEGDDPGTDVVLADS